jgi:hypothetical protein
MMHKRQEFRAMKSPFADRRRSPDGHCSRRSSRRVRPSPFRLTPTVAGASVAARAGVRHHEYGSARTITAASTGGGSSAPRGCSTLPITPTARRCPAEAPIVLPDLPPAPQSWYFCESARAYYPYTQTCPEGWRSVPATPAGERRRHPQTSRTGTTARAPRLLPLRPALPRKWRPVAAQPRTPPQGTTPPAPATGPEGASKP